MCSDQSLDGNKNNEDIDNIIDFFLNSKDTKKLTKRVFQDQTFYRKTVVKFKGCVVKRIFSLLVSLFLIFVPIVSISIISSPVNSNQNEIYVSLYPENVYKNDTMFVNVSVPFSLGISSIVADMGGFEIVVLSLLDNNSYIKLWQATWVVPDVDSGDYVATITLMNDTNGSFVLEATWSILPVELIVCNNNSDGMMNETNNQLNRSINQSVEDENDVKVPTDTFDENLSDAFLSDDNFLGCQDNLVTADTNHSTTNSTKAWSITETSLDSFHKRVTVASDIHYTNVTAFTTIDNRPNGTIHLYHVINGSRMEINFTSIDLDNDSLVDRIEWTVPHLSEQTYEIVIEIIKAEHLDKNRVFLTDIYDDVKAKDGRWSEPISNGEYVRVMFEKALENFNDITIVARSQGISRVEIYTKDSTILLAAFENITEEHYHKIYLYNLTDDETTFDLKTTGDAVEYDYIVDPTTGWVSPTNFLDSTSQWSSETRVYDDNTGTYATHTGGAGWRGFLELTLSSAIYCNRVRVFSDFGGAVDLVDIDIYNSTSWVDKYNGTISNCAWSELSFTAETNVTKARFRYHYTSGGWNFWLYEFDFWQGVPLTLPNGITLNATSVDKTTAILRGNVSDDGGEPCEYRFQYGSNTSYGINTSWGGSEIKDSQFGTMIYNLTLGQTYQYRVQVRNSIGTVNGSNKNFTAATPSLGWVTPTNFIDPNTQWQNENNIYDDDTDTYARSYHDANDPDGVWSFYIHVNHSVLICDKVRFYAKGPTGDVVYVDQVDLDVKKGGVWVDVYQGTFTDRQWVEKSFTQGSASEARIRFRVNSNTGGLYYELYEFDFNNSRPVPMITNERPSNRSWGVTLRPQLNITVNNPDGTNMTIDWSSNSSGSWQVFGTNSTVGNGTYHQINNNFSANNTKYWWKIFVTDGTDSNTSLFYFSTPDTLKPSSNVDIIASYWKKTSPFTITTTATDTGWSGLKNVTLYYRFSNNNASWGGWKSVSVDTASPWSWSFSFSNGSGYYQFYSIAKDNATNVEVTPGNADAWCGYDATLPSSSVDGISPYWKTAATTITATGSDATSGVKNVTLYYRFSSNNVSWGGWKSVSVDTASPWLWSFSFSNGSGYYQFYSIAKDNATNAESAPGSADTRCGYDNQASSSSVNTISGYWKTSSPLTITASASENGPSGLKNVTLFYQFRTTNVSSWGGNVSFGIDSDPWVGCSWSFSFPNGAGHYQFHSVSKDNASNVESTPATADTSCGYDVALPSSSVDVISPYWKTSSPMTITTTANDATSGVKNVTLYYRFSSNNATWSEWVSAGVDTASPWSWGFMFSNGTGFYQFYSIAKDNATNVESAPAGADAVCGFDNQVPSSSVSIISSYWKTSTPQILNGTASDIGSSGLKNVALWYRFKATNTSSWGGWVSSGLVDIDPWVAVSWNFPFGNGTGHYQFYSITSDNASNVEGFPGGADAWCGFDNQAPSSSVNVISGYWNTSSPLIITATTSDSGPSGLKNVTLFYRYRATNLSGWGCNVSFAVDVDLWVSCSWSFAFSNGTGHYQFYSIAKDNATNTEATPGSEDAWCGYDNQMPTSSVSTISEYWKSSSPLIITATASDIGSGVKNVTLYYRFSGNNASWGGWVSAGVDTAVPWSWNFMFSNGTGYYQFYSIARDNITNIESNLGSMDARCGYDITAPSSSVNTTTPYWKNAGITITAAASDELSGLKNVTLYYRFSGNNASWGGWVSAGVDSALPWSWSFVFSNGSGYYQFYSIAKDHATNVESVPGSADSEYGYDNQMPTSSLDSISGYWKLTSPLSITGTVFEIGPSGLKNVTLFYRYRATNASSWGSNVHFGIDVDPWVACNWSFTFPNGPGHYQLHSIATDNATNTETAPGGNGDTTCGFNTGAPVSFVNEITAYWTSSIPLLIDADAEDVGPSGVKNVTLFYYNGIDNITWSGPWRYGIDTDPWINCSWNFLFPNQTGYYRFYSCAADNSSHVENAPLNNDTGCGYDIQSPTCTISYNTTAGFFKTSDSLKIFATFTEPHSGMDETSVFIAISTMGNGNLSNVSMNMVDNTHWSYDWIIPAGSDEDGPFTIRIYANDNVTNNLNPYPTIDSSKQIDNTPPVISNLSVDDVSTTSVQIVWLTTEDATSSIEYGPTPSYGFWFNSSAFVIFHQCTLSGLSSSTTYYFHVLSTDFAGNYNTSMNQTFTTNKQTSKSRNIVQVSENKPPSSPIIEGPITGRISQVYLFKVRSIDANNDTITYTFDWGDDTLESSGALPNGLRCIRNHSWTRAGKYTIEVTASDTTSSSSSELTVWIDAVAVIGLGYLLDNDSDGIFDVFYNNVTGVQTVTEIRGGVYLIDVNGDQRWDYEYNATSGTLLSILQQLPSTEEKPFPWLFISSLIIVVFFMLLVILYRRGFLKK